MKNSFSSIKVLTMVALVAVVISTVPAFAQEEAPKYEFFGGFSAMSIKEPYIERGGAAGFETSFTGNLNSSLGIKADFGFNSGSIENYNGSHIRRYTIMGGPQITRRTETLNLFGHVLAGYARIDDSYGSNYLSLTDSGLALAFGGGVDWKISPTIGWRVAQVDYMPVRWGGSFSHYVRFSTGVLIPIGK